MATHEFGKQRRTDGKIGLRLPTRVVGGRDRCSHECRELRHADQQHRNSQDHGNADASAKPGYAPALGKLVANLVVEHSHRHVRQGFGKLPIFAENGETAVMIAAENHPPAEPADLDLALAVGHFELPAVRRLGQDCVG